MTKILSVIAVTLLIGASAAHAERAPTKPGGGGVMMEYDETGEYTAKAKAQKKKIIKGASWMLRGAIKLIPGVGWVSLGYDGVVLSRWIFKGS